MSDQNRVANGSSPLFAILPRTKSTLQRKSVNLGSGPYWPCGAAAWAAFALVWHVRVRSDMWYCLLSIDADAMPCQPLLDYHGVQLK